MNWVERFLQGLRGSPSYAEVERDFVPITNPGAAINKRYLNLLPIARDQARIGNYRAALESYVTMLAIGAVGKANASLGEDTELVWLWERDLPAHGILKATAKCLNCLDVAVDSVRPMFEVEYQLARLSLTSDTPPDWMDEAWRDILPPLIEHIETGTRWRPRQ